MRLIAVIIALFSFQAAVFSQNIFTDVTSEVGIKSDAKVEGVSVGDFNNDGYDDIYACSPSGLNHLYMNKGDGTFEEIAEELGVALSSNIVSIAAVWGDIDNDGWLDLYVANKSVADQLFYNNGNPDSTGKVTFTEISFDAGIYHQGYPKALNMADINNDGYLDIYISNFLEENVMYLNNGDLTFTNNTYISQALDVEEAMGTIFFDYDKDGDVDLYLVHDDYTPNILYQNDGNGVFTDVSASAGANKASFGMGVDVGDINHDGWLDIYIANLGSNFLLLNNGDGTFLDISVSSGTNNSGMGWGTIFLDYDNDSWEDIYVANLWQFSPQKNILYRNKGDLTFEIVEENEAVSNMLGSYGTASVDYNMDGQMDILVAHRTVNETLQLFKNANRQNNWISLKLVGTTSNKNAVGAVIELTDDNQTLHYQEVSAGLSWLSQNSFWMHFGLGNANAITEATIKWPSGLEETIELTTINDFFVITEGEGVESLSDYLQHNIQTIDTTIIGNVLITPNPNVGDFKLNFYADKEEPTQITLLNSVGQILHQQEVTSISGNNELHINLSNLGLDLSNQVIYIRISNSSKTFVNTCLVQP